ncbi:MAG: UDP-2,3-diacylglucosamine diphosphatase [Thermoanaerobaculia bacterium]
MPVAVLADAHLSGPGGDPAPLLAQLAELPERGVRSLVLLGDLFQAWVGYPQFETAEIRAVVAALAGLRRRGVRVSYVEGNRDFFLGAGRYREAFDDVGSETRFETGGRRFLAVHGDGLNDRDWQYRAWRSLSKSAVSRFLIRNLPPRLAGRMVHGTERRLSGTNFKHRARIPEEAIRAYAATRLAEGFDVLLLGHFHEPRTWRVGAGEVRLLEAWFSSRRIELLD